MASKQTLVLGKSLDLLRDNGYLVDKTEHFVSRPWKPAKKNFEEVKTIPGFRKDLLGFIDAIGLRCDHVGLLGLQVTTAANISSRRKKSEELGTVWRSRKVDPETKFPIMHSAVHLEWWLRSGNRFQVHGWRKGKSGRWEINLQEVRLFEGDEEGYFTYEWRQLIHIDQLAQTKPQPGNLF